MDQFIQYTLTEVVFGKETENQAGAEVKKWGGTKVLVVYGGGSAKRSGLLDRVEASLAKEGLAFEELGGVKPNPRLALAEEGVKKQWKCRQTLFLPSAAEARLTPQKPLHTELQIRRRHSGISGRKSTADKISPGRSGSDDSGSRKRDE